MKNQKEPNKIKTSAKKKNEDMAGEMLRFFFETGILKKVPRTGWTWRNVPDCESIADHCYRVNLIAMALCDIINFKAKTRSGRLNFEKVARMSILHEIAECRIGDIPYPAQKYIGPDVKTHAEAMAVKDMTAAFGGIVAPSYEELWREFEEGKTPEAALVKAADKLEMLIQAVEYEKAGAKTLDDFWKNETTFKQIEAHPFLSELLHRLIELRPEK